MCACVFGCTLLKQALFTLQTGKTGSISAFSDFHLRLVTYYIEGAHEHRHHLMEEVLAKPQRAYGVRGSLFSFLLPWEQIQQEVEKTLQQGNLSEWPLSPSHVWQILRVRFVREPVEILNKFKELSVRCNRSVCVAGSNVILDIVLHRTVL